MDFGFKRLHKINLSTLESNENEYLNRTGG